MKKPAHSRAGEIAAAKQISDSAISTAPNQQKQVLPQHAPHTSDTSSLCRALQIVIETASPNYEGIGPEGGAP
jgi:hypothetical protein